MNEIIKGTFKKEVANIQLQDYEVSNVITKALLENGYDLLSKPIFNDVNYQVGEQIAIYKIEKRI